MGCCKQQTCLDCGPSNERGVGITNEAVSFQIATYTPPALDFVKTTIGESLDAMGPSTGNNFGAWRQGATINNCPCSHFLKTGNFLVHGSPELFSIGTRESFKSGRKVRITSSFGFKCRRIIKDTKSKGALQEAWMLEFMDAQIRMDAGSMELKVRDALGCSHVIGDS